MYLDREIAMNLGILKCKRILREDINIRLDDINIMRPSYTEEYDSIIRFNQVYQYSKENDISLKETVEKIKEYYNLSFPILVIDESRLYNEDYLHSSQYISSFFPFTLSGTGKNFFNQSILEDINNINLLYEGLENTGMGLQDSPSNKDEQKGEQETKDTLGKYGTAIRGKIGGKVTSAALGLTAAGGIYAFNRMMRNVTNPDKIDELAAKGKKQELKEVLNGLQQSYNSLMGKRTKKLSPQQDGMIVKILKKLKSAINYITSKIGMTK